jgi:DNA-binding transcriptional ArsR family regulator
MATTTRKPVKGEVGQHSKAGLKSSSKPSKGSADARRESQARRASILLKHVSDPIRLQALLILAEGEQDVGTLCVHLCQSQPAVSHHLAMLRHGGVIVSRRQGTKNFYGLTDTGCELVEAVQKLLGDGSRKQPAVRPRPTRASSPPMKSRQPTREGSTDSRVATDLQSNVQDGADEAWGLMNRRRAELIFKKNRGHLSDAESSKFERLQELSRLITYAIYTGDKRAGMAPFGAQTWPSGSNTGLPPYDNRVPSNALFLIRIMEQFMCRY